MKSQRNFRLNATKQPKTKHSNSPTLASSYSQKSLWTRSFQNEPFPKQLRRRIIGHKFEFEDFTDEEEEYGPIVLEEEEEILEKKKKSLLPHFKIISDRGEFSGNRNRIMSEKMFNQRKDRCRSVESVNLQKVEEKEEEELFKTTRSKLTQFKDRNQFNLKKRKSSQNQSSSFRSMNSFQVGNNYITGVQSILENDAQETKSQKLRVQKSSLLTATLERIRVDQIDEKYKEKDRKIQQIECIMEQKNEQQNVNVNKLRKMLSKFEQEQNMLKRGEEMTLRTSTHFNEIANVAEEEEKRNSSLESNQ